MGTYDVKTFSEVMHVMTKAKVTLNVMPAFRKCGHERMFYALSCGSMLLTDHNEFLAGEATADLGIQFFPDDMYEIDGTLGEWLDRTETLDARRVSAVSRYSELHTRDQRIKPLLTTLNEEFFD